VSTPVAYWIAVAIGLIINALQAPDTGTDARGMAIASGAIVVAASAGGTVALIIAPSCGVRLRIPLRRQRGWYADPSDEGTWRFWDGHCCTNRVA